MMTRSQVSEKMRAVKSAARRHRSSFDKLSALCPDWTVELDLIVRSEWGTASLRREAKRRLQKIERARRTVKTRGERLQRLLDDASEAIATARRGEQK